MEINNGLIVVESLTVVDCIRLHRKLWNWLAENPERSKDDWPEWCEFDDNVYAGCFACEYADNLERIDGRGCQGGNNCLFVWADNDSCSFAEYGVWDEFNDITRGGSCVVIKRNNDDYEFITRRDLTYDEYRMVLKAKTKMARIIRDLPINYYVWGHKI